MDQSLSVIAKIGNQIHGPELASRYPFLMLMNF